MGSCFLPPAAVEIKERRGYLIHSLRFKLFLYCLKDNYCLHIHAYYYHSFNSIINETRDSWCKSLDTTIEKDFAEPIICKTSNPYFAKGLQFWTSIAALFFKREIRYLLRGEFNHFQLYESCDVYWTLPLALTSFRSNNSRLRFGSADYSKTGRTVKTTEKPRWNNSEGSYCTQRFCISGENICR